MAVDMIFRKWVNIVLYLEEGYERKDSSLAIK